MNKLLYPKSVVIIGVSNKNKNLGKNIINNLKKFNYDGEIYAVGRERGDYNGVIIYSSVEEIPYAPDLAVIITPYNTVPLYLEECGKKTISRVIIESGGFAEYALERKEIEDKLTEISKRYNLRFLGPNCLGIINRTIGLNLCFMEFPKIPKVRFGNAILAQSGGIGLMYLNAFLSENIPWAIFVSLGNMTNIIESDIIDFLNGNDSCKSISLYLETLKKPQTFFDIAQKSSKPIVIHKANISPFGERAAKTHTSAMLNDDLLTTALFKQSGVVRATGFGELLNCVKINSLPPFCGKNLGIISRSGGHAVVAADSAYINGFNLPPFPDEFISKISSFFRAKVIKAQNPLDLGDLFDFEIYLKILREIIILDSFDGLLFIHVFDPKSEGDARKLLYEVQELIKQYNKPIIVSLHATNEEINNIKQTISIPIFGDPDDALKALGKINIAGRNKNRSKMAAQKIEDFDIKKIKEIVRNSLRHKKFHLNIDAFNILKLLKINCIPYAIDSTIGSKEILLDRVKFPVTLKVLKDDIYHKSDVGGVLLNIKNQDELREKIDEMGKKFNGSNFLIQEMAMNGEEVFIGAKNDEQFGPVVTFGLGGILVELYNDVSSRLAPLSDHDIDEMISEVRSSKILLGFRGKKNKDIKTLKDVIRKVSFLIANVKEIKEMDINPLFVFDEGMGVGVADVRIIIR